MGSKGEAIEGDRPLRFVAVGAGFWQNYQLAAWGEVPGVRCVAVVDRDISRAQELAKRLGVEHARGDLAKSLDELRPDFVDIVTTPETHEELVKIAAAHGVAAVCQKPLATELSAARSMLEACRAASTPLAVHENWRWQTPIRGLNNQLLRGEIGDVFRGRIEYNNSFPVFDNQPNLKQLPRFILGDMGPHLFDAVRFLFGEVASVYCQTSRTRDDIRGEDVASTLLRTTAGVSVGCDMSYSSRLERDHFPETRVTIEGTLGTLTLEDDFWVSQTTEAGTLRRRYAPPHYTWADARYGVVHSSMVGCHQDIARSIRERTSAETSGEDNLKTLAIIEAAYQSAAGGQAVRTDEV